LSAQSEQPFGPNNRSTEPTRCGRRAASTPEVADQIVDETFQAGDFVLERVNPSAKLGVFVAKLGERYGAPLQFGEVGTALARGGSGRLMD
jgi:hypothetical protein